MPWLTKWHNISYEGARSGGTRPLDQSAVCNVNERIVVLFRLITMRDAQNDSASSAIKIKIVSM
jgi:hypothetical protein